MWIRSLTIAAVTAVSLAAALPNAVRTSNGLVSGVAVKEVVAFKGIPFAAPPVGNLRWQAPQPAAAWKGVKKAEKFSNSCVQNIVPERKPWTHEFMAHNEISEDCLYLNVWTGAKSAKERQPVFVWFHGGGYVEGSAAVPVYDGTNLAKRGVVVVTINYRLGLLGFLAHPELTQEAAYHASGNYGLLDQIAALKWVKANIAAFGGNPENVTIGGQSAGAGSVHSLVSSPLAKGLFQRGIAESGSGVTPMGRVLSLKEAEEQGVKYAESKGVHSLKELRALTWQQLAGAQNFRPIVDGYLQPASGPENDVPFLTGMTADEGSAQPEYGALPAEKFREQAQRRFGDLAAQFFKLYPAETGQTDSARDQGLVSMYLWGQNRAKTAKSKLFTYYWTHAEPGSDAERFGAFHTSEVPYVFDTLDQSDRPWTADDHQIARTIGSYWINFMKNGDPNGEGLPPWPVFDPSATMTMELGEHFAARRVASGDKLEFFSKYFAQQLAAQSGASSSK